MKKTIIYTLFLSLTIGSMLSCMNDENQENTANPIEKTQKTKIKISSRESNIEDFSQIKSSTNLISTMFLNLGVKEIRKTDNHYKFITFKGFKTRGYSENMSDYEFEYTDNILSLKNDSTFKIYRSNGLFYLESPTSVSLLKDLDQKTLDENKNVQILLVFLNEITTDDIEKTDFDTYSRMATGPGCGLFNTEYAWGIGMTGSAAWANYQFNLNWDLSPNGSGDLIGCRPLGNAVLNHYGDFYYVLRPYCCN
jgi:hypothetical protein